MNASPLSSYWERTDIFRPTVATQLLATGNWIQNLLILPTVKMNGMNKKRQAAKRNTGYRLPSPLT